MAEATHIGAAAVAVGAQGQRRLSIGRRLEELRGVAAKAAEAAARFEDFKAAKRAAIATMQAEQEQLYAEHNDLQARQESAAAEIKALEAELRAMEASAAEAAAPAEA